MIATILKLPWLIKIGGVLLLIAGVVTFIVLRDRRLIQKGRDMLAAEQRNKLSRERERRDDNEDDLRTTRDNDLDDELRERPRRS